MELPVSTKMPAPDALEEIVLSTIVDLSIETFDTSKKDDLVLNDFVSKFDMMPGMIIERLDLLNLNYKKDTLFSHFGHDDRNWEKIEDL